MARRKQDTSEWEEISGELTTAGRLKLAKGDTLTFMQNGKERHWKVMAKTSRRVWIAPVRLYDPDEVDIVDKESSIKRKRIVK